MTQQLDANIISGSFIRACREELTALKPGNVHIHASGHDMDVSHFEAAAIAAAPYIANSSLSVGARINKATHASFDAANCNTNLGIILLCAPLAAAADTPSNLSCLRQRLKTILSNLDIDDAKQTYEAIAYANPAGLAVAPIEDVKEAPTLNLREGMALAANRDKIANAYITDFQDIFENGLPILQDATAAAQKNDFDPAFALTTLHMYYLATFRDSHIIRKHGLDAAETVRDRARALKDAWNPIARPETFNDLLEFDKKLKEESLNPGTTADFVVATIFAATLNRAFRDNFERRA